MNVAPDVHHRHALSITITITPPGVANLRQREGYESGQAETPGAHMSGTDSLGFTPSHSLLRQLSIPLLLSEPDESMPPPGVVVMWGGVVRRCLTLLIGRS